MSSIIFNSKSVIAPDIAGLDIHLRNVIQELAAVDSYNYGEAFMYAPKDESLLTSVKALIVHKKYHEVDAVLVVGIGGSNLAVKAIHGLLQHTESNRQKKEIFFAETVDPEYTQALYQKIEGMLAGGKKVLLVIATKSGTTTETVALASLFIECFKRHYKTTHHNYIVAITDNDSPLSTFAKEHNYTLLTVPARIGGRYSVFSAVGLFPLAMMGYDIDALCQGARMACNVALDLSITKNKITQSALTTYQYYRLGIRIHNMFLFAADAASLGAWYRQLTAESLGKVKDTTKGATGVGILPIVSIGSTDLHSMVQLYFANPVPILTTFVTFGSDIRQTIPDVGLEYGPRTSISEFGSNAGALVTGKSLHSILNAIESGTMQAYEQAQLPFMKMQLEDKSEYSLGEYMQWKMIETVMLGRLLEINPFDQPEVERYKQQTRKILTHE